MAKQPTPNQRAWLLPYMLIIGGIIGWICSFIITLDKLALLANPHFHPNCDLNPVISCGSVMASKQGSAFGFPNSFIGLAAFAVVITVGVAILAGARYKRWFWLGLNGGLLLAIGFVHWLFYQSVYQIHALCPYCIVVWIVTISMFWYVTLYNIASGYLVTPKQWTSIITFAQRYHLEILVTWFVIIAALILKHFWYYYGQHI